MNYINIIEGFWRMNAYDRFSSSVDNPIPLSGTHLQSELLEYAYHLQDCDTAKRIGIKQKHDYSSQGKIA